MFAKGDKVRWQVRNKNRSNRRAQSSFLRLVGQVITVTDTAITCEYKTASGATDIFVNTHTQEFRKLRNGKWIATQEDKDDPKGRLYLMINND